MQEQETDPENRKTSYDKVEDGQESKMLGISLPLVTKQRLEFVHL